jgi:L-lactate dehydrogenase (cytochrome)
MAGGERGVDKAIAILSAEFSRTLQLLGVPRVADLNRSHVSLRGPG